MLKQIKLYKTFYSYFPLILKRNFFFIFLSTLLLGILEMLTVSIVIPIISILLNINAGNFIIKKFNDYGFEIMFNIETVVIFSIIFLFIFFLRSLYCIWHSFYQSQYIYQIQNFIAEKLYNIRGFTYLDSKINLTYENLAHKIINETSQLSVRFSGPLSIIFSEICIVLGLFMLMFLFDFMAATLFFSVVLISSGMFYLFVRKKVGFWGKKYIIQEQARTDLVLRGISDGLQIYLLGLKDYFMKVFKNYNDDISKLLILQRTTILSPRVIIELFSLLAIFIFIITFIYLGRDNKEILASAILIAFLGMRAMPSLNKIAMSLQDFRFARPLIESIVEELKYSDINIQRYSSFRNKPPVFIATGTINIKNKNKKINLSLNPKDSVLITGPSGCGKSTLLRSLLGLDNKLDKVSFYQPHNHKIKIAFINSMGNLFKMSLIENILLGRKLRKEELISIIDTCGLQKFDLLGKSGQKIFEKNNFKPSSGEKQRLILARALVGKPDFLVLDEALSALDKKNYNLIEQKILRTFPGIFIHVSHHNTNNKNYTHLIEF